MAPFGENPGLDVPFLWEDGSSWRGFLAGTAGCTPSTTAHAYKSHLANGHLGKAVPEKSGWGWVLGHDQASAGGGDDYLGLLGYLSGSRLLTEEVALGQSTFIE